MMRAAAYVRLSKEVRLGARSGIEPLPADWAVPPEGDEVVVALSRLRETTREGAVALTIARTWLPLLRLDDEMRDCVASSLADALLVEVL